MYGRWEGEPWFHRRHMWPVPSPSTPSVAAPTTSSVFIDPNSFSKDGRKIHVGDCALFKPPHDSPPFIGIIRRLIVGKKDNLSLSVNWLYRPADIKLVKGASLEAAPNEVFYSFHKDEIPAASLLHPCKVTFLRKGVELPPGISSFVCRRVYDIEGKRLFWLTDQDYINSYLSQERQEEVDQLLNKTREDMYGAVQTGGRSPKPLNGPNGTAQLKPSPDNVQNSSSSIPSQVKSKKRDHTVHGSDYPKRERLSKSDDADSGQLRPENTLKTEIAKITDKGGLVNFEGVEKLVQLMQPESTEKKIDLASRILLVDVIAVTDRFDCLGRFVQLRGLPVLDEWLQQVHKGKIGDGSPKENDKSVEDFLFALLRALDRLPVNLHALQTCNVGKSVNLLRGHKNSEIQKKARSLVDTWKKRVEAEMNIIETKSGISRGGSWPSKSMMSEVSHMSSRRVGGTSEVGAKSPTSQPSAIKAQLSKHNSGEAAKSPVSPGSTKLQAPAAVGAGSSDMPLAAIKEEKTSSSSQSPNNSQSCSSDHGKTGFSCREDARSSTAGSFSVNKTSSTVSRSRKSSNGIPGFVVPGVQKEGGLGKFGSVNRNIASEKGSPTRLASERVVDMSPVESGNNPRLIVRLPNTGRSPARTGSGGSPDDSSTVFGKGSPLVQSEKQDHHDRKARGKADTLQGNNVLSMAMELSQAKDKVVGSDEVKKEATGGVPCNDQGRNGEIGDRLIDATKDGGPASGVTLKSGKSYEASYSSINALVESCAKFSEATVCASVGDDVGMNLLASVAAGEISRSDLSPVCSPETNSPVPEDSCSRNDAKLRQSMEQASQDNTVVANEHATVDQEKTGECNAQLDSPAADVSQNGHAVLLAPEVKPATNGSKDSDEGAVQSHDQKKLSPNLSRSSNFSNLKHNSKSRSSEEDKNNVCEDEKATENNIVAPDAAATSTKVDRQINDESASCSSSEVQQDKKKLEYKQSRNRNLVSQEQPHVSLEGENSALPATLKPKAEEADEKKAGSHVEQSETQNMDSGNEHAQENIDKNEALHNSGGSGSSDKSPVESNRSEQPPSKANSATISMPEVAVKLDFDLNEVLPTDDGFQGEVERSTDHIPCPLPSSSSPVTGKRPTSITIAAAAKGPFFPSENLLRGKVELGWKGSAATSAFRPAEPRKVVEVPLTTSDVPASKQARPFLDFDLNVGVVEDAGQNNAHALSGGGLDLDLNACDESPDIGPLSVSSSSRIGFPQLPSRSLLSNRFSNSSQNNTPSRDFDLNNGPCVEEIGGESIPLAKNGMQFLPTVPGVRMNMDMGNFSSWFSPTNTYPTIPIPPILPGRGSEQGYPMIPPAATQRLLNPVTASTSYNPEIFRGPVLSSSPAVAFPSTTPFQYPGFPFETNFSIPQNSYSAVSTAYMDSSSGGPLCFPTIPSQLVGPSGVVSTPYRPYVMGLPGGSSNPGPDSRKWVGQGLDLNAGPGGIDLERRDEKLPSALRQLPLAGSSQAMADEQLKMFQQMAGSGVLKRKEPDGGWDGGDRISYKHPSWQ